MADSEEKQDSPPADVNVSVSETSEDEGEREVPSRPDTDEARPALSEIKAESQISDLPIAPISPAEVAALKSAIVNSLRQPTVALKRIPFPIVSKQSTMSEAVVSGSTSASSVTASTSSVTATSSSSMPADVKPKEEDHTFPKPSTSAAATMSEIETEPIKVEQTTSGGVGLTHGIISSFVSPKFQIPEKKKRGHRGPDKVRNIDPKTGKRRYVKRNIKRFGGLVNGEEYDFEVSDEKRRKVYTTSKYYTNSGIPKLKIRGISSLHRPYQFNSYRHHRQHSRKLNNKYTDYYMTPLASKQDVSDEEEEGIHSSWEDLSYDMLSDPVWRPTDDLRLIINVLQTNDLHKVFLGTTFSCHFSIESIEARWTCLLYDKASAKVSQNAIRNLPGRIKEEIYSKALFSDKENDALKKIKSTSDSKQLVPVMQKVLNDNPLVFFQWRTPKQLLAQWMHLRDFHLLCDQNVKSYFQHQSFADFERSVDDESLLKTPYIDEEILREKLIQRKIIKKKIRKLEEDIKRWKSIQERCTEFMPRLFEEGTLAMLRGKQVRYLMRTKEITFGRRTETNMVDADLALEGSTYKISRRQGIIRMRKKGDFVIQNQGKHAIYLNGRPLQPQLAGVVPDNSVIQISQLSFVFIINQKVVRQLQKTQQAVQSALKRQSLIRRHSGGSVASKAKFFPSPSPAPQLPLYQPPFQSTSSIPAFSLKSIMSPSFSNTLPALNMPGNSTPTSSRGLIAVDKTTATKSTMPLLNKSPVTLAQFLNRTTEVKTLNTNNISAPGSNYRPSWYLGRPLSQSQPPPLVPPRTLNSTTAISGPIQLQNLPLSILPIFRQQVPSLSASTSQFVISHGSSIAVSSPGFDNNLRTPLKLTSTISNSNATTPAALRVPLTQLATTGTPTSTIQFGDLTIRPGFPPPTEATTLR